MLVILLNRMDVGDVADMSKVNVASIFSVEVCKLLSSVYIVTW
jgi:hypothetical protein